MQVEPAEFMCSMLDLCATVSCLEIWKIFQFACVIFLIDNLLFCMRNCRNACYISELEIWKQNSSLQAYSWLITCSFLCDKMVDDGV